jgi:hypothetical protein
VKLYWRVVIDGKRTWRAARVIRTQPGGSLVVSGTPVPKVVEEE